MPLDYGALIGAGLGIGSAVLQGQQAGNANQLSRENAQRLFDLAAQEQARKDALTRAFLPGVFFGMGSKNPIGAAQSAYPTTLPGGTTGGQFQAPNPYQQQQQPQTTGGPGIGSGLLAAGATAAPLIAKGIGAGAATAGAGPWSAAAGAGSGGGIGAGLAAAAPFAIPAAAAIGGAAWLKSQAHWEANDIVKNLQNPYHQKVLAPLSSGVANGSITPQQGVAELDRTWAEYQQQLAAFAKAKGSDGQKVAQQSYSTLAPLIAQMRADMLKQGGGQ